MNLQSPELFCIFDELRKFVDYALISNDSSTKIIGPTPLLTTHSLLILEFHKLTTSILHLKSLEMDQSESKNPVWHRF